MQEFAIPEGGGSADPATKGGRGGFTAPPRRT
jgi:hypothetical protein